MLAHAWSEQAIELATPARGAGRRFGARADAVVAKARSALDVLHQAARPARWQVAVAEPVERYASDSAPAAITAGSVFFACTAPRGAPGVVALARSDGRVLWRAACGPVEGLATAAGVVAVSRGEQITAFDAGTGRRLWQLQADTPPQADSDRSLLTAAGGRLLFATSGHLTALDPLTGKAAWRQEVPYANRFPTMVAAGKVIVCSQREQRAPRSAIAFDLANGQRLWTLDLSEFPSFGVGTVLLNGPFQTPDGSLVCRLEERTDRGNTLVWRSVDLDRGTLLPAAPHDALSALYPRYGVLPWTGDTEIGQVGPSGSAASWQAETVGGKTRNGYLAVAGQQGWLAVGDNLASLDPASLLPNQRRFLGDQAIGLAADEQEAVVLLANGQAACLAR